MNKRWPYFKPKQKRKKRRVYELSFKPGDSRVECKEVKPMPEIFWKLMEQSTIVQGVITSLVVITTCYLWASGKPVPSELWTANTFVLAFFFGAKTQNTIQRRLK